MFNKETNYEIGRRKIDDIKRAFYSKRALNGTLKVIREGFKCPYCAHDKAFKKRGVLCCTRCKGKV